MARRNEMIPVYFWGNHRGYWDHGTLLRALDGRLGRPARFPGFDLVDALPEDGGIVVVPGGTFRDAGAAVAESVARMPWALTVVVSDEEFAFPVETLPQDDRHAVWTQHVYPVRTLPTLRGSRTFGCGVPEPIALLAPDVEATRPTLRFSFSGQVSTPFRLQLVAEFKHDDEGFINETGGFAQGLDSEAYAKTIARSRFVLCPGGYMADSFRLYETLELGRIPIAFDRAYYSRLYPGAQFPVVDTVAEARAMIEGFASETEWLESANRAWAWWMREKRQLVCDLVDATSGVRGSSGDAVVDNLTAVVPTSCVPSCPDVSHLVETVESIRASLGPVETFLLIDGLRPEQVERRMEYAFYVRAILRLCAYRWTNVIPVLFDTHTHQAAMTRAVLPMVRTRAVAFVEHDTPILPRPINVPGILDALAVPGVNAVRLHYDESIHPEHEYLMLRTDPVTVAGVPLLPTRQWSQRPHLARTSWYRSVLEQYFAPEARTMIEDRLHGVVQEGVRHDGFDAWGTYIYAEGWPNAIKRSTHTDARQGDPKYEDTFRW